MALTTSAITYDDEREMFCLQSMAGVRVYFTTYEDALQYLKLMTAPGGPMRSA